MAIRFDKLSFLHLGYGSWRVIFFQTTLTLSPPMARSPQSNKISSTKSIAEVVIENISPAFVGFKIDPKLVIFNFKSTLAQLGLNAKLSSRSNSIAKPIPPDVSLQLSSHRTDRRVMLPLITPGAYIGKLFAADDRRRVRDPEYLSRMFGRADETALPCFL